MKSSHLLPTCFVITDFDTELTFHNTCMAVGSDDWYELSNFPKMCSTITKLVACWCVLRRKSMEDVCILLNLQIMKIADCFKVKAHNQLAVIIYAYNDLTF